ncbi:MAG: oligopeptide transport ATP-binding protein OppD [Frankiales bacterium]|nr:oligopeptide transport ATP-binding protein OppD [Frankiales bacterium]
MTLLQVDDLSVTFRTDDGLLRAVHDLSFSIEAGKTLGIVGESGSGKSVSTQTIMGLTRGAKVTGTALYEGRDLLTMPGHALQKLRGNEIAMIFQDPLSSLHPHYKVGRQIEEVVLVHTDQSRAQARARAVELLGLVGIPQPHRRVDDYPHQFSGGMRQRAMIAMALALNPKLIIADEPTTALDVTVQAQILDLLAALQKDFDAALIMITHDLGVVAEIADDVLIMYAGTSIEQADRDGAYYRPHHPYTRGLLASIPSFTGGRGRLKPIPGAPPSLISLPKGCSFHPRCAYVMDACLTDVPPLHQVEPTGRHLSACFLPAVVGFGEDAEAERIAAAVSNRPTAESLAEALGTTHARPEEELAGLLQAGELFDGAPPTDLSLLSDPAVETVARPGEEER